MKPNCKGIGNSFEKSRVVIRISNLQNLQKKIINFLSSPGLGLGNATGWHGIQLDLEVGRPHLSSLTLRLKITQSDLALALLGNCYAVFCRRPSTDLYEI